MTGSHSQASPAGEDGCPHCSTNGGTKLGFEIAMAFQPIIDISRREIFAHEALVRTAEGGPAGAVFAQINDTNRYAFDQTCRRLAIRTACELGLETRLSINFMPNAVYEPANCIRATLAAAKKYGLPLERIMLEVTESEKIIDHDHLKNIIEEYKRHGFLTAIDDFGAGYSGLNFLAQWQPDFVKLDMQLTRNIDKDPVRRRIAEGLIGVNRDLGIRTIAEGIESQEELASLRDLGVSLFQGFLLARPAFRQLHMIEDITWPEASARAAKA